MKRATHRILAFFLALTLGMALGSMPQTAFADDGDGALGESGLGASGIMPLASTANVIDLEDSDTDLSTAAGLSGGAWGFDGSSVITIYGGFVTVTSGGSTVTNRQVVVEDGATVMLHNVNMDTTGLGLPALALNGGATATIVLSGDNFLHSDDNYAGLEVPTSAKLTIQAADESAGLDARGGNQSAGIGGGRYTGVPGEINIQGGNVTAIGGNNAAGIGGRVGGGEVKISGGRVYARSGGEAAGIGGGMGNNGGTVTITGGEVLAAGNGDGRDIGAGAILSVSNGSLSVSDGAEVYLLKNGCGDAATSFQNCTIGYSYNGARARYGGGGALEHVLLDLADVREDGPGFTFTGGLVQLDGASPAYTLTTVGVAVYDRQICVAPGVTTTVTLDGVNISTSSAHAFDLNGATVDLLLEGSNRLYTSNSSSAGVHVPAGSVLRIGGSGSLKAQNTDLMGYGAGIGGGQGEDCGSVTVLGGHVVAESMYGAGIGGGGNTGFSSPAGHGGDVTISGGSVSATSNDGAGVGGGFSMQHTGGNGGRLTVCGGSLTASTDFSGSAAIGGGGQFVGTAGGGAAVIIAGGSVEARSAGKADIGGGDTSAHQGTLRVSDGAALTLAAGGIAVDQGNDLEIGECVIGGTGAGAYAGNYSPLTVTDGSAAPREPYWIDDVVKAGTAVTLTADSKGGYAFTGWQTDPASFTFSGNSFQMPAHSLAVRALYNGTIHAQPPSITTQPQGGTVNKGESFALSVSATGSGTLSYQWRRDGAPVGTNSSTHTVDTSTPGSFDYSVVITNTDPSATGTQTATTASSTVTVTVLEGGAPGGDYQVSVSASPANGGTVTGGGAFAQGSSVTVNASPGAGYTFVNWTENGSEVSASQSYTFTVRADRSLVANFTATGGSSGSSGSGGSSGGGSSTPDSFNSQLALSGLPGTVGVGESFTLVPSIDTRSGSDGWQWDDRFFTATFNSPATFTALKAGKTKIIYTGLTGYTAEVEVEILGAREDSAPGSTAEPNSTDNPNTGRGGATAGIVLAGSLCAAAALRPQRDTRAKQPMA